MLGIQVVVVHHSSQVLGHLQITFDEASIDDEFRGLMGKLSRTPSLNLPAHRLEIALHTVDADGNAVL